MTRLEIIMITDVKVLFVGDVFVDNELIDFWRLGNSYGQGLSAAGFSCRNSINVLNVVLEYVLERFDKVLPDYKFWFLVGNSAWQPDTRIIRYRRLWGGLKSQGIEIKGGSHLQEHVVEGAQGLKFFGAVCISEASISGVVSAISVERCSYLVMLPNGFDVGEVLSTGWSGNMREDFDFINCVCSKNGIVIGKFGDFDDEEKGLVAIGFPILIKQLLGHRNDE